jgi:hypothetical protein
MLKPTAVRLSEQAAAGKSTTAFGRRDHRRAVVNWAAGRG